LELCKIGGMKKQPNIIYILGDDHRAEYMGCSGHPLVQTPALDDLARRGVRFANAFCTSPVCTPSRTCHYTGRWERSHGVNFNSGSSLTDEAFANTFPMLLKQAGYSTAWVGKNHMPAGRGGYKSGLMEKHFDFWYGKHDHNFFYVKEHRGGEIYRNAKEDTQVEVFTEGVMNFLEPQREFYAKSEFPLGKRDPEKPFCLCVTFNLPHDAGTYDMQLRESDSPMYKSLYRDKAREFPFPKTYRSWWGDVPQKLPRDVYNGVQIPYYDYVKMPESLREKIVRTAQTITGMDCFVAKLVKKLEELGEADNTIIIFSTDHGLHFGEFGLGGKNFLYEADLRIPLIVYDPRLPAEKRNVTRREMVCPADLASTVLELAGLTPPEEYQGASLRPLLHGENVPWRKELFVEALMDIQNYPRSEGVRTEEWKYIRYFRRTEDPKQASYNFRGTLDDYTACLTSTLYGGEQPIYEELYNLLHDPHEETNLATHASHTQTLAHFRHRILELGRELCAK
jgi:arylsulfatase A-like enzyme